MKKVVIVHGYNSSPKRAKYQIISKELTLLGVEHSIPQMPGGEYPHSKDWLEAIDKEVSNTQKPVVLVSQSLGTRAVLLYLDKYEKKVDMVILVAAFNNDFENNGKRRGGNYADFFEYALDIDKIKKLANKFIVVHSIDDDAIEYKQGEEIASQLGAELITYHDKGHFSGEENAAVNAECFLKVIKSVL